ncbi:MAG: transcriptional regulator [Planctomycetota bacterium]|nr:MAG: transcriptional regulator [Planctomycetota bacterium]
MSKRGFNPTELNKAIHSPIRLAIVSTLYSAGEESFTNLRKTVGATDGNLTTHISTLEKHGIIKVRKRFIAKKPRTSFRLTDKGREVFREYIDMMASMVSEFQEEKDAESQNNGGAT